MTNLQDTSQPAGSFGEARCARKVRSNGFLDEYIDSGLEKGAANRLMGESWHRHYRGIHQALQFTKVGDRLNAPSGCSLGSAGWIDVGDSHEGGARGIVDHAAVIASKLADSDYRQAHLAQNSSSVTL